MQKKITPQHGLTLVEVLVTVLILFVILGLSYSGLNTMLQSRDAVPKNIRLWSEIERVFDRLEFDFTNLSWQAPINPSGQRLYPLMVDASGQNGALTTLTISRFSINAKERDFIGDGQLVGYQLNNKVLELLIYPSLYLPLDEKYNQPKIFPLLDKVTSFSVEVLDENNRWNSTYPTLATVKAAILADDLSKAVTDFQQPVTILPRALRVTISREGIQGNIVRLFNRIR